MGAAADLRQQGQGPGPLHRHRRERSHDAEVRQAAVSERPVHAVIGWGRLARALVPALRALGDTVWVGSRQPEGERLPAAEAAARADWVWLTVPDDHIAGVAAALPWRAGQLALHCSGATSLQALAAAPAAAGFHPLRLLATDTSADWRGYRVGIEAAPADAAALTALAERLGLEPLTLPWPMSSGQRAAYHAAANLAASGVLAVLAEASALWADAGLSPDAGLGALLPLTRGALATAEARGLPGAVSGPVARGDLAVLKRHLEAAAQLPQGSALMRALAYKQMELAVQAGRVGEGPRDALLALLRQT
ncbi:MAG: DUF2520 domain-containing protein [Roseateles depolymerans]|uniref:DUF2520 domain-containing protein n=1 Tax=Roseateles depolymerans TaxID=76731 RepID=A0A2W5DU10_9BURK|nr:MAG: DUF2520 domain-containing protein [Roseateles depolymerans]